MRGRIKRHAVATRRLARLFRRQVPCQVRRLATKGCSRRLVQTLEETKREFESHERQPQGFMGASSSVRVCRSPGTGCERAARTRGWLAAAQSPRPASSLRNSHAISRRRAIGYALDQRFACSLRPIFCAFAPFSSDEASAARPPAGTGTGGKDAPRDSVTSAPFVASGACLQHAIMLRAVLNSYAPIIMRSPHPHF